MNDEEALQHRSVFTQTPSNTTISPYDLLLRQSRKMGRTAMGAFNAVRVSYYERRVEQSRSQEEKARSRHEESVKKLNSLRDQVRQSHEVLAKIRAVFPLDLFPDTVIVDRTKVTIVKRDFFWSSNVISVRTEDILNVTATIGPFFGSLNLSSRVMNSVDHYQVGRLWRDDAIFLKHIIQGYVIAKHNNIEMEHLERAELIEMLCELGIDTEDNTTLPHLPTQ